MTDPVEPASDALIREIEEGLEGVTPGPWSVCQKPPNRAWHAGVTIGSDSYGVRVADGCVLAYNVRETTAHTR